MVSKMFFQTWPLLSSHTLKYCDTVLIPTIPTKNKYFVSSFAEFGFISQYRSHLEPFWDKYHLRRGCVKSTLDCSLVCWRSHIWDTKEASTFPCFMIAFVPICCHHKTNLVNNNSSEKGLHSVTVSRLTF